MAEKLGVVGVEINARKQQIEVIARQRGQSRHVHYASLNQAPHEVRGEALALLRAALVNSGYQSLADLDALLTSELVVPEKKEEA
ncbi:hypothetical protein DCC79_08530 [bacterium]|nr:MAG: hypothetical protein DCC79_08530 [bacterium]